MPSEAELLSLVRDMYEHIDPVPDGLADLAGSLLDVRALTVRQPWASAIVGRRGGNGGPKNVENRPWKSSRRGLVLIHAGQRYDHAASSPPLNRWMASGRGATEWTFGAILGTAAIEDCHRCDGSCSEWAEPDAWHFVLGERRAFPEPVAARGLLGFWRPDADTLAAMLRQIAVVLR